MNKNNVDRNVILKPNLTISQFRHYDDDRRFIIKSKLVENDR